MLAPEDALWMSARRRKELQFEAMQVSPGCRRDMALQHVCECTTNMPDPSAPPLTPPPLYSWQVARENAAIAARLQEVHSRPARLDNEGKSWRAVVDRAGVPATHPLPPLLLGPHGQALICDGCRRRGGESLTWNASAVFAN